mmetsp:Transcript_93471/g.180196  ORF Transcript_93471/g.180196 Transcript_93471/m.180196 type:complete len:101 (+) Transcript_93471:106-408(+)
MANVAQVVVLAILAMMVGSLVGCGACDKEAVKEHCSRKNGKPDECKSCGEALGKCCDETGLDVKDSISVPKFTGKDWIVYLRDQWSHACKNRDDCLVTTA